MSSLDLLQSLKESILLQANVKAISGEPIVAHGKTVIPAEKIVYPKGGRNWRCGRFQCRRRGRRRWRSTGYSRGSHRRKKISRPVSFRLPTAGDQLP
jgi:hypothetical protein